MTTNQTFTRNDPTIKYIMERNAYKVEYAKSILGDKWVLHPKHAPKNKTRATASSHFFLGV